MKDSTSKERILEKVRKGLFEKGNSNYLNADFANTLFGEETELPEILFANNFIEQKGNFIFCQNEEEAIVEIRNLFISEKWGYPEFQEEEIYFFVEKAGLKNNSLKNEKNKISITLCECLIASTGSILISSRQDLPMRLCINCKIHIVIAFTSQMVNSISESLRYLESKYLDQQPSQLTYITGPSKTADIEQKLVYGAHGPKEIYCFLIEG